MGDQDVREFPAVRLERGFDRCSLGCIDRSRRPAFGVMQQYAVVIGSTAKQANFCGHELDPLDTQQWVNRITQVSEVARPSVPALLGLYYFVVVCRHVDRRRGPEEFLRPTVGCGGPSVHWTRHSLIVG